MGAAIWDYHTTGKAKQLIVQSSMFDDDEMPVTHLFRTEDEMPQLERMALNLCQGKVLDVGAGAGCHTLALEKKGLSVTSIDISSLSTQVRRERGAKDALQVNIFDKKELCGTFDTIILLMNGLGIAGILKNLPTLLLRCKELLRSGGKILTDSTDLSYIYRNDDETFDWDGEGYYGEVDFRMTYGKCTGDWFDWLYVDFDTLKVQAAYCGMKAELIAEGENSDYLACITIEE